MKYRTYQNMARLCLNYDIPNRLTGICHVSESHFLLVGHIKHGQ